MPETNGGRKLTEQEKKRSEQVQQLCGEMETKGYHRRDLTVSILAANLLGIAVCLPFLAAFVSWFMIRNGADLLLDISAIEAIFVLVLFFALIFVHEGLHGLTWGVFCPNRLRDVEFGFIREQLTPYCYCRCPLKRSSYLLGSLMPFLVLGVIPCAVGCLLCLPAWLMLGLLMIIGAGGDLLISLKLLAFRSTGRELVCLDHPTECGLIVFTR